MKTHLLPTVLAHADWGTAPAKRWAATAKLEPDGSYHASPPERVRQPSRLLPDLLAKAGNNGCAIAGFDFPIGLPVAYCRSAGIESFIEFLVFLRDGNWPDFWNPATRPEEVSRRRPFYPFRPGGAKLEHLLIGIGLEDRESLFRECERAHSDRSAASPLFWTIGGKQVGKAALSGWREVILPAVDSLTVRLWPFHGRLAQLLQPRHVVVAETYPAEYYPQLGVRFLPSRPGQKSGKRVQTDRARQADSLLAHAEALRVSVSSELEDQIRDGFGKRRDGEDPFDALVGLLGMINVLRGKETLVEPLSGSARDLEGWILGRPTA